jgi:lambda repressor-like predicted transcriptional regulator
MMKISKWLLIGGVVIFLGAAALVAFSLVIPYARAQGPLDWGDGGFGSGFSMDMHRGMMSGGNFGPGFDMGPGRMMGIGGPENSLLSITAEKLGMTPDELMAELQAGKSIADVAKEKNVSIETIVEAVLTSRSDRMNQMVTSGQMTQEQADAMLAQMKTHLTEQINVQGLPQGRGGFFGGPGGHEGMGGMMGGRGGENPLVAVAADKLGVTPQELFTELQAGKSIADVAKEKNVALNTIVEAALAARTDRLNKLVADGQLTQPEVDNRLSNLRVDIVDWLNQSWSSKNTAPDATPDGSGSN